VIIIGYLAAVILKILPIHGQCSAAAVWIAWLLWIGVFRSHAVTVRIGNGKVLGK